MMSVLVDSIEPDSSEVESDVVVIRCLKLTVRLDIGVSSLLGD